MATTVGSSTKMTDIQQDWLKIASVVLAIIGLLISGYIVLAEVTNTETVCPATGAFNCGLVQHSIYSRIGPIPVAWLGLVGYVVILAVLLFETRIPLLMERSKIILFGLTLFGVLFSGYLTAIEALVLKAWCIWCVGSAITMFVLFFVSLARLWRTTTEIEDFVEDEA